MANIAKQRGASAERVARNVRALRQSRGLDLADLSEKLTGLGQPISISGLSKLELGSRRVDVDDLAALAEVFGCTPDQLVLRDCEHVDEVRQAHRNFLLARVAEAQLRSELDELTDRLDAAKAEAERLKQQWLALDDEKETDSGQR